MGIIAHSAPNIESAVLTYGPDIATGPVHTAAFVSQPLFSKVNGIMNMVFAYGGAMIFPEVCPPSHCGACLTLVSVYGRDAAPDGLLER